MSEGSQAHTPFTSGTTTPNSSHQQNPAQSQKDKVNHLGPDKLTKDQSHDEIARKRAEREAKKRERAEKRARGEDTVPAEGMNAFGFNVSFIKRDLVKLANATSQTLKSRACFTLMTYNVLAQSLVRREGYPDSGEALKWKNRQQVLKAELAHYDPVVICMQECGEEMYDPVFRDFFDSRGYVHHFYKAEDKTHGLLIGAKRDAFELVHKHTLAYDLHLPQNKQVKNQKPEPTNNSGLFTVLKHKQTDTAITLATTHLFWHPKGTTERARQMRLFIEETLATDREQADNGGNIIMAGDFNTEPIDPTYLAATAVDRGTSTSMPDEAESGDQKPFQLNEQGTRIMDESWSSNSAPHPFEESSVDGQPAWRRLIDDIVKLPRLQSQYGEHYRNIHPENTRECGEPKCTNFAPKYRGTLDYIYTVESVHPHTLGRGQDRAAVELAEADHGSASCAAESSKPPSKRMSERIRCSGLLQLPLDSSIEKGQPIEGQFPSDHCCIMAEFEIL
ncbi:RNA exonuclease ngl2 [Savitreella phatthalungensis]